MNFSTTIGFLLLSVASAADTTPVLRMPHQAALASDGLTLTEAGWCAKCQNDWDNEDNGCADQKDAKRDNCAYRNRNVPASSDDTAYPTSAPTGAPTEDDAIKATAKLTLTEAGWCAKCKGDWNNDKNGCKKMKKSKEKNCEYNNKNSRMYSGSSSTTTSSDTNTPTSAPTEDKTSKDDASKVAVGRQRLRGALPQASSAVSLGAAAARNPLKDAMDALVNDQRFFRGQKLIRLLQDDDDDADADADDDAAEFSHGDAACEAEMTAIYSDFTFSMTLFKIKMMCPPEIEMDETSFSMTEDYASCDDIDELGDEFTGVCEGLSGTVVMIPDLSASCTLVHEETTYTSSYSMTGGGLCAGASCSTEYDEEEAEQAGEELAAEMESAMAGILALFGIEGPVDCDVDIGPNPN